MVASDRHHLRSLVKEVAAGVLLEYVVVTAVNRLRRDSRHSDAPSGRKHKLLWDLVAGATMELVEMARADVRWQRRRMAAAIDRAAVAQSISNPPVATHIPSQRAGATTDQSGITGTQQASKL